MSIRAIQPLSITRYGLIRRTMADSTTYSTVLQNTREQLQDTNKKLEMLETNYSQLITKFENQKKTDSKWVYVALGSIALSSAFNYYDTNKSKEEHMKNIELLKESLQEDINRSNAKLQKNINYNDRGSTYLAAVTAGTIFLTTLNPLYVIPFWVYLNR